MFLQEGVQDLSCGLQTMGKEHCSFGRLDEQLRFNVKNTFIDVDAEFFEFSCENPEEGDYIVLPKRQVSEPAPKIVRQLSHCLLLPEVVESSTTDSLPNQLDIAADFDGTRKDELGSMEEDHADQSASSTSGEEFAPSASLSGFREMDAWAEPARSGSSSQDADGWNLFYNVDVGHVNEVYTQPFFCSMAGPVVAVPVIGMLGVGDPGGFVMPPVEWGDVCMGKVKNLHSQDTQQMLLEDRAQSSRQQTGRRRRGAGSLIDLAKQRAAVAQCASSAIDLAMQRAAVAQQRQSLDAAQKPDGAGGAGRHFCPYCGGKLQVDFRFCQFCGSCLANV